MSIKVLEPGLAATVQDLGRPGYYHLGIPLSGAMDRTALMTANLLVGNNLGDACIEASFLGPALEFTRPTMVAVTGGNLSVKVDNVEHSTWESILIKPKQVLSFGIIENGARIYIGFSGGINVPSVLGSRSTYLVGQMGGFEGRAIKKNDVLPLGEETKLVDSKALPQILIPNFHDQKKLRVLPGLYWHRLTPESGRKFFEDEWSVANEADRMGYRFSGGRPVEFVSREQPFGAGADPSNIVDSAYPYGSIQIPGGMEPIVLHRDAVSAGGYFQIGTVISADMDVVGQLQPNKKVEFAKVSMSEALEARRGRSDLLGRVKSFINR